MLAIRNDIRVTWHGRDGHRAVADERQSGFTGRGNGLAVGELALILLHCSKMACKPVEIP
jgi:hypothetical protein